MAPSRLPPSELQPPPYQGRLWVAFSGGLDSTALLHQLQQQQIPSLNAVHVHHGLQSVAEAWTQHCRAICRDWKIPFKLLRVKVDARHADGPEAAAREARYAALRKLLKPGDVLAAAHHQDDQAETLLLRLLRGTGIAGLAGIRELTELKPGVLLWRPLLTRPRAVLLDYARTQGLRWIEDPHNNDARYARSYLRQELMPRLEEHWPQARASLARTAALAAEAESLLQDLALQDLMQARLPDGALNIECLIAWNSARRNNALRGWLAQSGWPAPSAEMLKRLGREVLNAKPDAQPLLHCGSYEFRRYRQALYVMAPLPPAACAESLRWRGGVLKLPAGCGQLNGPALRPALTVRFPQGGERLRAAANQPSRSLKIFFQEQAVPPWVRERLPLIYQKDRLIGVADLWRADNVPVFRWRPGVPGVPKFHKRSALR